MKAKKVYCAALGLAFLAAGCGTSEPEPLGEAEQARLAGTITAGYELSAELESTLNRIARGCMEDLGYSAHQSGRPEGGTQFPAESNDLEIKLGVRYMYQGREFVAEHGYGRSPSEMFPDIQNGELSVFDRLSIAEQEEYKLAYSGDDAAWQSVVWPDGSEVVTFPVDGCLGDAYADVFGENIEAYHQSLYFAFDGLTYEAMDAVEASPAVDELEVQWAQCMADNGFASFESPTDAAFDYAPGIYTDAEIVGPDDPGYTDAKNEEITLALADYACNEEVGLDNERARMFWDGVSGYLSENEAQIYDWYDQLDAYNVRAAEILSGSNS